MGRKPRLLLVQPGGSPKWLQAENRMVCTCSKPMHFVAQLETGPAALGKISPALLGRMSPCRLHDCAHNSTIWRRLNS